jgi:ABC-type polysaccharide transport system permease subunit
MRRAITNQIVLIWKKRKEEKKKRKKNSGPELFSFYITPFTVVFVMIDRCECIHKGLVAFTLYTSMCTYKRTAMYGLNSFHCLFTEIQAAALLPPSPYFILLLLLLYTLNKEWRFCIYVSKCEGQQTNKWKSLTFLSNKTLTI